MDDHQGDAWIDQACQDLTGDDAWHAMALAIAEHCERAGVPIDMALKLIGRQATILREIARASRLAEAIEDRGAGRTGFAAACKGLLARQITAFLQRGTAEDA